MDEKRNIIPLVDEKGNTTNYAMVAGLEENGKRYVLLERLPVNDPNVANLYIFELLADKGGEYLTPIDDTAQYEHVMQRFKDKLADDARDKYDKLKQ